MSISRLLLAVLLLACAPAASGQEALRDLFSADNFVRSAAIAGDTLYVAGDFSSLGPPTGPAAVLDAVTGVPDLGQARIGGDVEVVLPDGAGGWYVGGELRWAGGEARRNLAHILADGRLDPDFAPDPQTTDGFGSVEALALSGDSVLFVGGRFDTAGGTARDNLAAFDTRTGALLPFAPEFEYDSYIPDDVEALLVHRGVLYVGGEFDTVNGTERLGAVAFDARTGAFLPWDLRLSPEDRFGLVGVFGFGVGPAPGDTTLYLGGFFDAVRGVPRPSGSAEVTLADPATGEGGEPTDWTTTFGLGRPVVAEDVIWSNALGADPLFTISRETGAATGYAVGLGLRSGAAVALDSTGGPEGQGVVYLAAERSFPGDPFPSQYLVAVDAETKQPLPGYFDKDPILDGGTLRVAKERGYIGVRDLVLDERGRLFASGQSFFGVGSGSAPRRFLAGLDLTTGRVTDFAEEYVIFSSVEHITISPDERYLYFEMFNGLGVADLHTGVITEFPAARPAPNEAVLAEADGTGGSTEAGSPIRRAGPVLARRDGRALAPFAPPIAAPEGSTSSSSTSRFRTNSSAFVATDDRLYFNAGGGVIAYDRTTGAEIWATAANAYLDNPQADEALLVEAGPPGAEGDTLFIAGPIRGIGGETRPKFAALDAESGAVLDWNANPVEPAGRGAGNALAALGPPPGEPGEGRLYVAAGRLSIIGGEARDELAALGRRSGAVLDWAPDPDEVLGLSAMAAQPGVGGGAAGGVVYVGSRGYDAETGAYIGWDFAPFRGGSFSVLLAPLQERVILTGTFENSLRGSGHAFVAALTPARPFAPPPVSAEDDASVPQTAALSAAHPNPFRSTATVTLLLPQTQRVEVALFDVLGRRVAVLHEGPLTAGSHALVLDGSGLGSGVYVVRAQGEGFTASRRVTVVR